MRDILIVTGTGGVGKSSVCWEWAERRHGAVIECDTFRTWIRDRSVRVADGFQESLLARHAASLAEDYVHLGLDVAIDNVWTPDGISYLRERLGTKGNLRVFWLNCHPEENHRRDDRRSPSDVMGGTVDELQAELDRMAWPEYVERIDTTCHSLEQTIDVLEQRFADLRTQNLLTLLRESPVQYRHALGVLDPEYAEWRSEGRSPYRLEYVGSVTLMMSGSYGSCMMIGDPSESEAEQAMRMFAETRLHELSLLGETAFLTIRPHAPDGAWRMSRNYSLSRSEFRPRPSQSVRKLVTEDRDRLESACRSISVMRESQSTMRDFGHIEQGLPVACYGAFVGEALVGFCSSNPICRGVTEISWIVVGSEFRRQGLAAGLLTAACEDAFSRGDAVGYFAGEAGDHLDAMVRSLGFQELQPTYRFIPASSTEQWRTWGRHV